MEVARELMMDKDLLFEIMSRMDLKTLLVAATVCETWRGVARHDAIWRPRCKELWENKKFFSSWVLLENTSMWRKFFLSILDAKRERPTKEELCSMTWKFEMKRAPRYLRELEATFSENGTTRVENFREMRWCFFNYIGPEHPHLEHCGEGAAQNQIVPAGSLRICVGPYPPLRISRTHEWGWRLENDWVIYENVWNPNSVFGRVDRDQLPMHMWDNPDSSLEDDDL